MTAEGGPYFSLKVGKPCAPERSVREWYSEKVHVSLYQLNDGFCGRGRLHRRGHPGGWAEQTSRWRRSSEMWSKEACPVLSMRQRFSLTYKTIAAGRARGLSTSRKKKKHQRKNNNYNITSPSNPHEKQAMESRQFWEVVNVFNLFSFPLNPNLQATNTVHC